MGESADTQLLRRTKTLAQNPHVRRTAIGGGTVSILLLVYELFVTKSEFSEYKISAANESARAASVLWQELKTLENRLDSVRMDIVRLETVKTNKP